MLVGVGFQGKKKVSWRALFKITHGLCASLFKLNRKKKKIMSHNHFNLTIFVTQQ